MQTKMIPGKTYPLGATWEREGVNFVIYSETAQKIGTLSFDNIDPRSRREYNFLGEVTGHVWHGYLPGIRPGQL